MTRPPYPPYPPYAPYPPQASPPAYPPFPPYPPAVIAGASGVLSPSAGPSGAASGSTGVTVDPSTSVQPPPGAEPRRPFQGESSANPLPIFFEFGRYDVRDATTEGLGQGQFAKLAKFVGDAVSVGATAIRVDGFASPEQNLPNAQLPLHRATAVKNQLDNRFAATSSKPTITTGTTSVLSGDPSTYPSLRRANVYIVSPKLN